MLTKLLPGRVCALVFLCGAVQAVAADFRDHLGLQLWSLREQVKQNLPKALDLTVSYGFKEVETAGTGGLAPAEFARELQARQLVPVSAHVGYEDFRKDAAATIAGAKALGVKFVIVPSLPQRKAGLTVEAAHGIAAEFNTWARLAHAEGLQFGYHPHGFEFVATSDGTTPFDVLMRETDPALVCFEMDVFWVVHAGRDPVKLLREHRGRWRLLHVKDMRRGAVIGLSTGMAPPTDKVAVGDGQIDWPGVLRVAAEVGIEHYFLEDECTEPFKTIPASLRYLRALKD